MPEFESGYSVSILVGVEASYFTKHFKTSPVSHDRRGSQLLERRVDKQRYLDFASVHVEDAEDALDDLLLEFLKFRLQHRVFFEDQSCFLLEMHLFVVAHVFE